MISAAGPKKIAYFADPPYEILCILGYHAHGYTNRLKNIVSKKIRLDFKERKLYFVSKFTLRKMYCVSNNSNVSFSVTYAERSIRSSQFYTVFLIVM